MKKLICLFLTIGLLTGCAATYDGPTVAKPVLTEYTVDHYYAFFDREEHHTNRTVYAYDIYGNRVRYMEYQNGELERVVNMKYDERGNVISQTVWDHTGWIPKLTQRTKRTYDEQNRPLSYANYNFWGMQEGGSWYTYDDENGICTHQNENGEITLTTWFDENGNELRTVYGEHETVYQYDDRGNRTGWVSYKNGKLHERREARYDDKDRQIWAGQYNAAGRLTSQTEYVYDDEQGTMSYVTKDGSKRIEHYHADGRRHMIEDYSSDGSLRMLQRYYYRDIQVPAKEE